MRKHLVLLVALVLGLVNGMGGKPAAARFTPQPCRNAFSQEQEISEGQKVKAEVYKTMPLLPASSPITLYVQRLGARLVAQAPGYKWPYEFQVINEADINAFALPGGPIFVNLATVQAAETEAQLAGVLAHEISHVVQRHATCNATRQQQQSLFWGLGQLAAGIFLPGTAGTLAQTGIGAVAGLGYLRMSRDAEKQADLMGTDILYDANYDPRAMPQFFEIIQAKYEQGGTQLLSDHPNPGNRVGYVQDEIDTLPPKNNYVKTSLQFKTIHQQALAMRPYTAQEVKSGVWKSQSPNPSTSQTPSAPPVNQPVDYRPSRTWKTLDTADYSITYPDNWQARNGEGANVAITPTGGASAQGISHGVVMEPIAAGQGMGLSAAMSRLIEEITRQNPGTTQTADAIDVYVGKRPAKSVELSGRSPIVRNGAPIAERDWLVLVERGDGVFTSMIFICPAEDSQALRATYEQMLGSFRAN
jgi:beta-barrel assembly-enhancing protease